MEGGRCDACEGEGEQIVEMQFLADVHLQCEVCGGKRFKQEILEVNYNEKNIADVLELTVDDAILFFKDKKEVVARLQPLQYVGLGYIRAKQFDAQRWRSTAGETRVFSGKGSCQRSGIIYF